MWFLMCFMAIRAQVVTIDDTGQVHKWGNDTDTYTALQTRIKELEGDILALQSKRMAANVRIRELEDRAETCSPEWTGCTKLQVRAPGYQEEFLAGIYLRIGDLHGKPHFSMPQGNRHLYYTTNAAGSGGMGNWVFADAVLTGYRAHVESTAASPELVRGKWKVWNDGWTTDPYLKVTCLESGDDGHKAVVVHDGCTDGTIFQGFCYRFFEDQATWERAEDLCVVWGGHLASVHSAQENAFCQSLITDDVGGNFWFGLTLVDGQEYRWTDGTPVDYEFWESSRDPHAKTPEEQKQLQVEDGATEWSHQPAERELGYICKKALRWSHVKHKAVDSVIQ
jgi:hypothetical protein